MYNGFGFITGHPDDPGRVAVPHNEAVGGVKIPEPPILSHFSGFSKSRNLQLTSNLHQTVQEAT